MVHANNDVTDASVSNTGLNIADHRGQLITNQTAADWPFQTPPIAIDQEEEQEDILAKEDRLEVLKVMLNSGNVLGRLNLSFQQFRKVMSSL